MQQALADGGGGADLGGAASLDADVAEVAAPEVVAAGEGDGDSANAEWDGMYKEIEAKLQPLQGLMRWEVPKWASGRRSRAAVEKKKKKITIRGPGMESEHDFEGFIEYANRVRMDNAQFGRLKRLVEKHMPRKPLYVCTIKNQTF